MLKFVGSTLACFQGVSHTPDPRGRGPSVHQISSDLPHGRTQYEKQQPYFTGWCEENFYTVDHECWRAICLW